MNETEDAFDVVVLIAAIMIFIPVMIYCTLPFLKGDVGGFDAMVEKTARQTESEIIPVERPLTTEDVILMLVVADRYAPRPGTLRISTSGAPLQIELNDAFFANRTTALQNARAKLPVNQPVELELYSGPSGMRYWDVHQ